MRRSALVAVALLLLTACGSSNRRAKTPPAPQPATVAWRQMRNPMLRRASGAVKDPALVLANGMWFALYSRIDARGHWRIGVSSSHDLATWTSLTDMPHDPSTAGEASPDVTRAPDGGYVVTYQSFPNDRGAALPKLYARTTTNFTVFSNPIALVVSSRTRATDRLIDPALAWTPSGLFLGYKYGTDLQHFELARSRSGSIAGPWTFVGRPNITVYGDTIENYQFIRVDGTQYLLATSNQFDRPELFTAKGNSLLDWSAARELKVPTEAWNTGRGLTGATYEHANCAFLVDNRRIDGFFYLVYADAPDMNHHDVVAIARGTDLAHWSVPPR